MIEWWANIGRKEDQEIIFFQIDDEDFESVSQYLWWIDSRGYPLTTVFKYDLDNFKRETLLRLHSFLMGKAPDEKEWDHIDRNRLNNQRSNLRIVTHQINQRNHGLRKDSKTGHRGINFKYNKFLVRITVDRQEIIIGRYLTIEEAIEARKAAETKYWGDR